eukprot:114712_1
MLPPNNTLPKLVVAIPALVVEVLLDTDGAEDQVTVEVSAVATPEHILALLVSHVPELAHGDVWVVVDTDEGQLLHVADIIEVHHAALLADRKIEGIAIKVAGLEGRRAHGEVDTAGLLGHHGGGGTETGEGETPHFLLQSIKYRNCNF